MSETVIVVESITPQVSLTFSNDQGPQGAGGNVGPAGTAATIAVGAVATGAPGSAATVTNVGTSSAATLNFSIPQGNPGTVGSATPLALGTAAVGTAAAASHEDHVHPTTGLATSGANSNITSLSGLTTPLSAAQGGTGLNSLGTGVATFLATPTSANLFSALTTETGTGNVVFGTAPTISTPIIDNPRIGYTTTATAAGTTTLTAASNYQQFFTGSTTQTVKLPDVTTLTLGTSFYINNNSTGVVTVQSSGLNTVLAMPANTTAVFTCILITGTTAASWDADYTGATTITGTGSLVFSTSPTLVTPALGIPASGVMTNVTGLPLTTGVTGTLPVANGGTGITALGTGIATALGVNVGTAGAPVINGGALGTPSGGTLTNATGLPIAGLVASTSTALGVGSIELGHASDTTLSRSAAGVLAVEGVVVPTISSSNTLTNKTLTSPKETTTVSATAAATTVNFDTITQAVLYYTTNATANWALNVRGNSGTTFNSITSVGDSMTVTFLNTNGTTAYYPTSMTIDGTAVTPKWQGGTAPASGNVSSVDAYNYVIVKTAATPTYTVFASQTKFA